MGTARAQLSAEALLVFLIFIIVLGISYSATVRIGAAAQEKVQLTLSKNSFSTLVSKIEQCCTLGSGNIRTVEINGNPASLSSSGKTLSFATPSFNSTAAFSCEIEVLKEMPSKSFRVENVDGKITIS
jgi:uncharacterized protein (UPF0333 family)